MQFFHFFLPKLLLFGEEVNIIRGMKNPELFSQNGFDYDYFRDTTPSPENHFTHMHNYFEFLFFFNGTADYMVDGKTYHLQKNDLVIIAPSTLHSLMLTNKSPTYERSVFFFQPQILTESQLETLQGMPNFIHLEPNNTICQLFRIMRDVEPVFTQSEFLFLEKSCLFNIIATLSHLNLTVSFKETPTDDPLDAILRYISENITLPLTATMLAKKFFVSDSWLNHTFATRMYISVKKYINQKRILYAQNLIQQHMPIAEVINVCGYDNYSTFYRQYKKFIGSNPLQDKLSDKNF